MGGGWSGKKPYESPRPSVEPQPYKPETIYSGEIGRSSGYGESGRGNEAPAPQPSGESGRSIDSEESGRAPVVEKPASGESGRSIDGEGGRAPVIEKPASSRYEAPTPGDIARRRAEDHYAPQKPSSTPTSSDEGGRGYSRGG